MASMKKAVQTVEQFNEERHRFFKEAESTIAETNLTLLRMLSILSTLLVIIFDSITPFIIPGWQATIHYILLIPVMAFFAVFSCVAIHKEWKDPKKITILCLTFLIVLMGSLLVIDVFPYPKAPSTFIPILLAVSSVIFIFPLRMMAPYLIIMQVIFGILVFTFKDAAVKYNDFFTSIIGVVFGYALYWIVTKLRASDHNTKVAFYNLNKLNSLTGVLDKNNFEQTAQDYLKAKGLSEDCALMVIDLDNFKEINATYGDSKGDKLLEDVGSALIKAFRVGDCFGRINGDEFVVLVKNIRDSGVMERKCGNVRDAVGKLLLEEVPVSMTCSIGVAVTAGALMSYSDLFQMAYDALCEAKSFGKNRYVLHCYQLLNRDVTKELMLIADESKEYRDQIKGIFGDKFDFVEVEDGRQALSMLSQHYSEIDIALMETQMPSLDGYEVLRYMKQRPGLQHIPVLMVTADMGCEERVLASGASDVIIKPIVPAIIKMRVSNLMKHQNQ